jgi:hypothetical protein
MRNVKSAPWVRNPARPCKCLSIVYWLPHGLFQEIDMLRPAIVRTVSVALLVSMTVVACSGWHPVETGIPIVRAAAPATIAPGATIRFVVGTDSRLIVGHLNKLSADSLIIDRCEKCDRLRYGTCEISRLEVLRGSSRGRHFGIGLLFGAFAGLIAAVFENAQPCHTDACGLRMLAFYFYPPFGALIGGIIGVSLPTGERWEPVSFPHQMQ